MSETSLDPKPASAFPDLGETAGVSLGVIAGLAGGMTALVKEADDLFHQHQIDIANTRLDAIDNTIGGLVQAQQTLTEAGQKHTPAYAALEKHISLAQTHESAIEQSTPHNGAGQRFELAGLGVTSLLGCMVLGAAVGNYIGRHIDRFRSGGNVTPEPAEA